MNLNRKTLLIIGALVVVQAIVLVLLGQPAICQCGYVKVWESVVQSIGNSQHLSDWYTFSHIIHGFVFYAFLWYFFPRLSTAQRLVIAVGIEVAWELLENTPMVINAYRTQALAAGYAGDSILNSLSDTIAMMIGFVFASRAPVVLTLVGLLLMEIFVAAAIRDNLALNVVNLIHSFDAIQAWQAGS
jgi:hypothetical protein